MTLSLEAARGLIAAVRGEGEARGLSPLSACVVDAGGFPIAFERADGVSPMRFAIAHGKANGAVMMGLGSRAIAERAEAQPHFVQAMNALAGGALVPVPGGVLIRRDGAVIGALGVTGDSSDADEGCAVAAIEAVGLQADPGGRP